MKSKYVLMYASLFIGLLGIGAYLITYSSRISNYPFPLSWSESGRIFNAYQVFAPITEARNLSWPWLDPARAILDGLIFLVPYRQIWLFRFWVIFQSFTVTGLAIVPIVRRAFNITASHRLVSGKFQMVMFVLWGFLFLLQGPIYAHLILGILPILWFYEPQKPALVFLLVVLGSMWEGLSRVNWFLMPAVIAILLYVLTEPILGKNIFRYLAKPVLWLGAGGLSSVIVYGLFLKLTGYPMTFLNPEMRYGFFRFKLWPNDGFPLGLIPGIVLAGLPVGILMLSIIWKQRRLFSWPRLLLIAALFIIFFSGSTLVSLRAGGGYDLHNYDTFLLIVFLCGVFIILGAVASEDNNHHFERHGFGIWPVLIIIPVFFAINQFSLRGFFPSKTSQKALKQINLVIKEMGQGKNPILLIDHRQLLIYHFIPDMELVIPYEKIELMEMAMANNKDYFVDFWKDIQNKKYPLIVSEVLVDAYQNQTSPFGYESNLWFENVSYPILKNYRVVYSSKEFPVAIYAPK